MDTNLGQKKKSKKIIIGSLTSLPVLFSCAFPSQVTDEETNELVIRNEDKNLYLDVYEFTHEKKLDFICDLKVNGFSNIKNEHMRNVISQLIITQGFSKALDLVVSFKEEFKQRSLFLNFEDDQLKSAIDFYGVFPSKVKKDIDVGDVVDLRLKKSLASINYTPGGVIASSSKYKTYLEDRKNAAMSLAKDLSDQYELSDLETSEIALIMFLKGGDAAKRLIARILLESESKSLDVSDTEALKESNLYSFVTYFESEVLNSTESFLRIQIDDDIGFVSMRDFSLFSPEQLIKDYVDRSDRVKALEFGMVKNWLHTAVNNWEDDINIGPMLRRFMDKVDLERLIKGTIVSEHTSHLNIDYRNEKLGIVEDGQYITEFIASLLNKDKKYREKYGVPDPKVKKTLYQRRALVFAGNGKNGKPIYRKYGGKGLAQYTYGSLTVIYNEFNLIDKGWPTIYNKNGDLDKQLADQVLFNPEKAIELMLLHHLHYYKEYESFIVEHSKYFNSMLDFEYFMALTYNAGCLPVIAIKEHKSRYEKGLVEEKYKYNWSRSVTMVTSNPTKYEKKYGTGKLNKEAKNFGKKYWNSAKQMTYPSDNTINF